MAADFNIPGEATLSQGLDAVIKDKYCLMIYIIVYVIQVQDVV